jgi:dTDP-4-amino-4,6-dideoxygalactose transaminase
LPGFDVNEAERALAAADIETRRWWGQGAHLHSSTTAFPRSALYVTETLAKSTLSVPFYRDIDPVEIEKVAGVVRALVS